MNTFTKVILFTDEEGRARFREETVDFSEGSDRVQVSTSFAASSYRLRRSPVGYDWSFHCTNSPMWVFILAGRMKVTLQDGTSRTFMPGDSFFAADTLPEGATFDEKVHGHWSRQVGPNPLVTLFVHP